MDLTGLSIVPPRPSISVSARARADSQPRRMAAHTRRISVECAQISRPPCMAGEGIHKQNKTTTTQKSTLGMGNVWHSNTTTYMYWSCWMYEKIPTIGRIRILTT